MKKNYSQFEDSRSEKNSKTEFQDMPIEEKRVTMESEIFLTIEAKYKDKKIDEESHGDNRSVKNPVNEFKAIEDKKVTIESVINLVAETKDMKIEQRRSELSPLEFNDKEVEDQVYELFSPDNYAFNDMKIESKLEISDQIDYRPRKDEIENVFSIKKPSMVVR